MAGDWIKMSTGLRTHPKVVRMASALKADRLRVIGGLWAVWSVFDAHSTDGLLEGYTPAVMDEELAWRGFSVAMAAIGWLEVTDEGLVIPRFDEHNSASAKRRAMETERKRSARMADKDQTEDGQVSASDADKNGTREEKRREEEIQGPPPGFVEFWSAWPKSNRKGGKADCEKVWRSRKLETVKAEILAHVRAMAASNDWTKQGGEFIPAPVAYLRGSKWDGADIGGGQQAGLQLVGAI